MPASAAVAMIKRSGPATNALKAERLMTFFPFSRPLPYSIFFADTFDLSEYNNSDIEKVSRLPAHHMRKFPYKQAWLCLDLV